MGGGQFAPAQMGGGNYLESCEMDHGIDVGVCGEDFVKTFFVGHIDLVEIWPFAAEELDAVEGYLGGVVETVDYHDFVAVLE